MRSVRAVGAAFAAFVVFAGAACGGSDGDDGSVDAGGTTKLTVVLPAIDPTFVLPYLAVEEGYFAAENLDVTLNVVGANVVTQLVSGQADLGVFGTANALLPVANGEQTSIILGNTSGKASAFVVGKADVTSLTDCTRMGAQNPGSGNYANATYLKKSASATYDIVPMQDFPTISASLVSGNIDCAVGSSGTYAALVDKGDAHYVVDPRDPSTLPGGAAYGDGLLSGAVFGMKENLEEKRTAVVGFVRAYKKAVEFWNSRSAAEVATVIHGTRDFGTQPLESITQQVDVNKQLGVIAPEGGAYPAEAWDKTLAFLKDGGTTTIDTASDKYSYASCVDMSYYDTATGTTTP